MRHHQRRWLLIQLGVAVIVCVSVAIVMIPLIDLTSSPMLSRTHTTYIAIVPVTPFSTTSMIYLENQRPGTAAWELDPHANLEFIQGYASRVSAVPGEQVSIYVSSRSPSTYQLAVYRIGWYGGLGGHRFLLKPGLVSPAQGTWFASTGLVGCRTCTQDPHTDLIDPHWKASYTLTIGTTWPSGVYLLKLTAANGGENYIPLVVRIPRLASAALVNLAVNTYQAYNLWGGYSLYAHVDHGVIPGKATKVTFNRPYDRSAGSGDFLSWDIQSVRWLERYGLDVTYTTDVDLAEQPSTLLHHRLFIDLGHDEYWTKTMRDGVQSARDHGVSLAFLGANDAYWQARLEPDQNSDPDRTLVCYKVISQPKGDSEVAGDTSTALTDDPYYATHPDEVTTLWSDPLLHQPASTLVGLDYAGSFDSGDYYPTWTVAAAASNPLLAGTTLVTGSSVRGGMLGYEFDSLGALSKAPAGLVILAKSSVINRYRVRKTAETAYYRAPSGAFVFDAGTIWWSWGLDDIAPPGATRMNALKGSEVISRLTANIILAMLAATPVAPA